MDSKRVVSFTNSLFLHPLFIGWKLDRLTTGPFADDVHSTLVVSNGAGLVMKLELSIAMDNHLRLKRAELWSNGRLNFMTEVLRGPRQACLHYDL